MTKPKRLLINFLVHRAENIVVNVVMFNFVYYSVGNCHHLFSMAMPLQTYFCFPDLKMHK